MIKESDNISWIILNAAKSLKVGKHKLPETRTLRGSFKTRKLRKKAEWCQELREKNLSEEVTRKFQ